MSTPRAAGFRELEALVPDPAGALDHIRASSPALAAALRDCAFGAIYARPELGRQERQIATVAMLAALGGAETELRTHLEAALRVGVEPAELIALAEHVSIYAGFPRALGLLRAIGAKLEADAIVPLRPQAVQLGDHETALIDTGGSGPPTVLIHSLGLDHTLWRDLVEPLAATRRVIAYDLRGHGLAAGAAAADLDRYADDLAVLLDTLGIEDVGVLGISMGGAIALQFAWRYPARARELIIACAPSGVSQVFEERAVAAERHGMAAQVASTLARWFSPEALAVNAGSVRWVRQRVLRADPADWAAAWRALGTFTAHAHLSEIATPALIVAGEADRSTPPDSMRRLATGLPAASFHVVTGAPHLFTCEQPGALLSAIEGFPGPSVAAVNAS